MARVNTLSSPVKAETVKLSQMHQYLTLICPITFRRVFCFFENVMIQFDYVTLIKNNTHIDIQLLFYDLAIYNVISRSDMTLGVIRT